MAPIRGGKGQDRHKISDLVDVIDALGLHDISRDSRDGQREILHVFLTPAGRNNDLLQQGRG
jgi:hypothetical protein